MAAPVSRAQVSDASFEKGFSALCLEESPKVSKETLVRFFNEPQLVGHIGSFSCETAADLTSFCLISKVFNSWLRYHPSARPHIFSGNSQLTQLFFTHCPRLDANLEKKAFISMLWARMKKTTVPDDAEGEQAFFACAFKDEASRKELVGLAWRVVLAKTPPPNLSLRDVSALKWLQTYDSSQRLQELILGIRKTITSWTFSYKTTLSDKITGETVKKVLKTFPMIRRSTLDPLPYAFKDDVLAAHIGFPIVELDVPTHLKRQDFEVLGKITTLQKLTLMGGGQDRHYFNLLEAHPNLTSLDLGSYSNLNDCDLIYFMQFPKLQSITARSSRITDKGFQFLRNVKNLTELNITYEESDSYRPISDRGLEQLKDHRLKKLNLAGCKNVRGGFLVHLRHIECLDELNLEKTWLSEFNLDDPESQRDCEKWLKQAPHLVPQANAPLHFKRKGS